MNTDEIRKGLKRTAILGGDHIEMSLDVAEEMCDELDSQAKETERLHDKLEKLQEGCSSCMDKNVLKLDIKILQTRVDELDGCIETAKYRLSDIITGAEQLVEDQPARDFSISMAKQALAALDAEKPTMPILQTENPPVEQTIREYPEAARAAIEGLQARVEELEGLIVKMSKLENTTKGWFDRFPPGLKLQPGRNYYEEDLLDKMKQALATLDAEKEN